MNNADLIGINQILQIMKTEKGLIDEIKKHADESITEWEKEFHNLPEDKKLKAFIKYQSEFISTLEKMLEYNKITGVTKAQLSNLRDFEMTAVNALSKQQSGEDLDEETKVKLEIYEGALITAINDLEEVIGIEEIKNDLEKLKKHHAYFITSILYGLHSGTKISSRQVRKIFNLMAIEKYLIADIIKNQGTPSYLSGSIQHHLGGEDQGKSERKFIPASLVDIVLSDELKKFKKHNQTNDFIDIEVESAKLMNREELGAFKKIERTGIENTTDNGETKRNENKAFCEKIIPMLLELQYKQEEMIKIISTQLNSKDKLQSDRVASGPEISALLEDEKILNRLTKAKIEMGVSDSMPAVRFQVVLPGEFFLEQLLLVRTR